MLRQGTTTVEIKSGYGLNVADEARSLRIAAEFTGDTTSTDFVAGDAWKCEAREAVPTAGTTIEAVEALIKYRDAALRPIGLRGNHIVHLAQKVADTSWDELLALVTDYWRDYAFPVNVETNVVPPDATGGEYDIPTWVNDLVAKSEALRYVTIPENDYEPGRLWLNAAFMLLDCSDGWRRVRPAGGVMAGLIAKTERLHESIGWTKTNKITGGKMIYPYNSSEDFVGNWNDFFWPLVVLNKVEMYTLPVGLPTLQGQWTDYGRLMAGSTLAALPTVAIFLAFQRYFLQGITIGAVKG